MKHKVKRIIDFLETADTTCLDAVVWCRDDDETPLWQGAIFDMPWWVAQAELDYKVDNGVGKPIEYRSILSSDRAGFVFCVK